MIHLHDYEMWPRPESLRANSDKKAPQNRLFIIISGAAKIYIN